MNDGAGLSRYARKFFSGLGSKDIGQLAYQDSWAYIGFDMRYGGAGFIEEMKTQASLEVAEVNKTIDISDNNYLTGQKLQLLIQVKSAALRAGNYASIKITYNQIQHQN